MDPQQQTIVDTLTVALAKPDPHERLGFDASNPPSAATILSVSDDWLQAIQLHLSAFPQVHDWLTTGVKKARAEALDQLAQGSAAPAATPATSVPAQAPTPAPSGPASQPIAIAPPAAVPPPPSVPVSSQPTAAWPPTSSSPTALAVPSDDARFMGAALLALAAASLIAILYGRWVYGQMAADVVQRIAQTTWPEALDPLRGSDRTTFEERIQTSELLYLACSVVAATCVAVGLVSAYNRGSGVRRLGPAASWGAGIAVFAALAVVGLVAEASLTPGTLPASAYRLNLFSLTMIVVLSATTLAVFLRPIRASLGDAARGVAMLGGLNVALVALGLWLSPSIAVPNYVARIKYLQDQGLKLSALDRTGKPLAVHLATYDWQGGTPDYNAVERKKFDDALDYVVSDPEASELYKAHAPGDTEAFDDKIREGAKPVLKRHGLFAGD